MIKLTIVCVNFFLPILIIKNTYKKSIFQANHDL